MSHCFLAKLLFIKYLSCLALVLAKLFRIRHEQTIFKTPVHTIFFQFNHNRFHSSFYYSLKRFFHYTTHNVIVQYVLSTITLSNTSAQDYQYSSFFQLFEYNLKIKKYLLYMSSFNFFLLLFLFPCNIDVWYKSQLSSLSTANVFLLFTTLNSPNVLYTSYSKYITNKLKAKSASVKE